MRKTSRTMMHFLYGSTAKQKPVILHAIGFSDKEGSGFYNNEAIYEVEQIPNPDRPDVRKMQVKKQVGVVKCEAGHLRFEYTDPVFKKLIDYKESTGYSSLDGAMLVNEKTQKQFMYVSARNPIGLVGLFGTRRAGNLSASAQPAAPALGTPFAVDQKYNKPAVGDSAPVRPMNLGISREKSSEPARVHKENREMFDWSGYQVSPITGALFKLVKLPQRKKTSKTRTENKLPKPRSN